MKEEWRPVVGFEGKYEVSNIGRVLSLTGRAKIIRPARTRNGYMCVILCRHGARRKRFVHHLVLEAFVGPRPVGYVCDHINTIRDDNRPENLRWVTVAENNKNPITYARLVTWSRSPNRAGLIKKCVLCVETGAMFDSVLRAAQELGIHQGSISNVCRGRQKTANGFHFKFV